MRDPKNRTLSVLHVNATPELIRSWKAKADKSAMTLKDWVVHTLEAGPALKTMIVPIDEPVRRRRSRRTKRPRR